MKNVTPVIAAVRSVVGPGRVGLHAPEMTRSDLDMVERCLAVDPVGYSFLDKFEEAIAMRIGRRYAVAVSSGTAALHLALLAVGVGIGDEVLCPTLTFAGVVNAIRYCGATPRFVDATSETLGVSAHKLRVYLDGLDAETLSRIKAMVSVDLLGGAADHDALRGHCDRYGISYVEDAAAALGSKDARGVPCGRHGRAAILSFNSNKIVTTGGGGMMLTDDAAIAARSRHLATTAKRSDPHHYWHGETGFNYRMPNVCAAWGLSQMARLDETIEAKRRIAAAYESALDGIMTSYRPQGQWNGWINAAIVGDRWAGQYAEIRDQIMFGLEREDIASRALFTPLHHLPHNAACPRQKNLAIAEDLFARIVCLPSGPALASRLVPG